MLTYMEKGIETPMAHGQSTKIIQMIKWIRTSRLSVKNSLSLRQAWLPISKRLVDEAENPLPYPQKPLIFLRYYPPQDLWSYTCASFTQSRRLNIYTHRYI